MLGDMDAIAGDGDHGRGMVRGSAAALDAAALAFERGAGAGSLLAAAGDAWADKAGGTSGVLWGAGLRAFGERLGDAETPTPDVLAQSVRAFADRISTLGKAAIGDKTMMDALLPFASSLEDRVLSGAAAEDAWAAAASEATAAAASTAGLRPLKGRARPLAEKSIGTPDPGATSLAMVFAAVGPHFTAIPVPAAASN